MFTPGMVPFFLIEPFLFYCYLVSYIPTLFGTYPGYAKYRDFYEAYVRLLWRIESSKDVYHPTARRSKIFVWIFYGLRSRKSDAQWTSFSRFLEGGLSYIGILSGRCFQLLACFYSRGCGFAFRSFTPPAMHWRFAWATHWNFRLTSYFPVVFWWRYVYYCGFRSDPV